MRRKNYADMAVCLAIALSLAACSPSGTTSTPVTPAEKFFTAGDYTVETMGHNGPFAVTVTFSDNRIEDIAIGKNTESRSLGDWAMDVVKNEILSRQSLNVDTIAGATVSSAVLKAAVTKAVQNAGGDPAKLDIPAPAPAPYSDVTCDVVVVGSGTAGMTAAVEANALGLNVILVEQLGLLGGSSVRAAYLTGAGTKLQAEQGISFPLDETYLENNTKPTANSVFPYNKEVKLTYAKMFGENIDWLYELGVEFGPVIQNQQHYGKGGERAGGYIIKGLHDVLDTNNVDYRLNTRATKIIMQDGKAAGVEVTDKKADNSYNIYGNVILATGGYFGSQEMVAKYQPTFVGYPTDVCIGADGSGMVMAEEVGAVLFAMDKANYHGLATTWNGASRSLTLPAGNGAIAVNVNGKRFVNESGSYEGLTAAVMAQEGGAFCIMDQQMMELENLKGDLGLSCIVEMYEVADTPEELAAKLGIDPEGLAETIETYSTYVKNGEDLEFGKSVTSMRSDFTKAPYYGAKSSVETHTVHGGIVVDGLTAKVLDKDGKPIKGLYAAGEVAANPIQSGLTNSISAVMGRLAARSVAESLGK